MYLVELAPNNEPQILRIFHLLGQVFTFVLFQKPYDLPS